MVSDINQTVDFFWDRRLPVSVECLASAHNLILLPSKNLSLEKDIGAKYSVINSSYIGEYNTFDLPSRQHYAKAYLLVRHLIQSKDFEVNETEMISRENTTDTISKWVREKVLSVLMPSVAMDYLIKEKSISNIQLLAKSFNVSEVDLRDRLIDVGWLPV